MGELGQQAVGLVGVTKLHRKHSSYNFAGSLALTHNKPSPKNCVKVPTPSHTPVLSR